MKASLRECINLVAKLFAKFGRDNFIFVFDVLNVVSIVSEVESVAT